MTEELRVDDGLVDEVAELDDDLEGDTVADGLCVPLDDGVEEAVALGLIVPLGE